MADNKAKFSLHDLKSVNTVLGLLYDENGKYRAGFKPEEFYNTILLDTLKYGEENFVHLKYAETVNIRKGEKVARFRRWAGMTPTLRQMMEGIPPAPDKHAYEYMEVGNVFSFGRWSEYTDQVDLSVVSEIISERSVQYGENASQTKELYARKTWLASPNEYFANFKDGLADLVFGDSIQLDDLRFLISRMKRMQVKPISGKFNYICSQEFINSLIDDPRVVAYMKIEQTTGNLWTSGEPFPLFEINFIPTMLDEFAYPDIDFPGVVELADGHEMIRLFAAGKGATTIGGETYDGAIYYLDVYDDFVVDASNNKARKVTEGVSYLADGTAIEDRVEWSIPTTLQLEATDLASTVSASKVVLKVQGYTNVYKPVTEARGKSYADPVVVTSADTTLLAAANALLDNGSFMQLPIHRGILFGDEAMIKLNIEGLSDAPRIIIQPLGSAGSMDPLHQRQTIGYRVDGFGLAIKRPEAICVTYGIPENAEFAALTAAYVLGEPTRLDNSEYTGVNSYTIDDGGKAYQKMHVDAVNAPYVESAIPHAAVDAKVKYPEFVTSTVYHVGDTFQYKGVPYVVHDEIGASDITTASVQAIKAKAAVVHDELFNNTLVKANDPADNAK